MVAPAEERRGRAAAAAAARVVGEELRGPAATIGRSACSREQRWKPRARSTRRARRRDVEHPRSSPATVHACASLTHPVLSGNCAPAAMDPLVDAALNGRAGDAGRMKAPRALGSTLMGRGVAALAALPAARQARPLTLSAPEIVALRASSIPGQHAAVRRACPRRVLEASSSECRTKGSRRSPGIVLRRHAVNRADSPARRVRRLFQVHHVARLRLQPQPSRTRAGRRHEHACCNVVMPIARPSRSCGRMSDPFARPAFDLQQPNAFTARAIASSPTIAASSTSLAPSLDMRRTTRAAAGPKPRLHGVTATARGAA